MQILNVVTFKHNDKMLDLGCGYGVVGIIAAQSIKMYMVTKRKLWYMKKFIRIFGGVKVYEREGYFVFEAEKRSLILNRNQKNKQLSKKLSRKYGKK